MKRCNTCGELKPFGAFWVDRRNRDGRRGTCGECEAGKNAGYPRQATGVKTCSRCGEQKSVQDFGSDPRKRSGLRSRCRACLAELRREGHRRDPRAYLRASRRWNERNPKAKAAHDKVRRALANGTLERPDRCECCHGQGDVHAHHDDYERPLDVEWLCARCHRQRHEGERRAA